MASSGLRREKHLLSVGISRLDVRYAHLPLPARILHLQATNLRNRPLSVADISSMRECIMSLYHNLVTGSKNFPVVPFRGFFCFGQTSTPFTHVDPEQRENTRLHPLLAAPAGILAPAPDSSPSMILTPVLPERTELRALWADRRNFIRRLDFNGRSVTRVISPVYHSDCTEMANRWRVTDYRPDGHVVMSVLCRFIRESARCATTLRTKRKDTEEDSSSSVSPPQKRIRV